MLLKRDDLGDLCGLVWLGDRAVHRSLVQVGGTAAIEGDRRGLHLDAGECYVHYCETVREHFGRGLYPHMLRMILSRLFANVETLRVFISCRDQNVASIRGIQKAGFEHIATIYTLGIAGGRVGLSMTSAPRSAANAR
jgi:RimJ/RimL family protein N-acetyltransferase